MAYSNFYAKLYTAGKKVGVALSAVWHFVPSRLYFLIVALLQIAAWSQAGFIYRHLSGDLLILHYNVDTGIDLVGNPAHIFIYPLFGLGIFVLNLILTAALYRREDWRIFNHLLLSVAALFGFFLNLVLLSIYLINFR
jgi:hypothetical protein